MMKEEKTNIATESKTTDNKSLSDVEARVIPPDELKGYIYDNQETLWGARKAIGFGAKEFFIEEIERDKANYIISTNHYSKKVFNNSYIHLGVFIGGNLLGVLQYGHLMNNNSVSNIVEGTENGDAIELNRMWLDDRAPRNSESRAVSYSIKYIKNRYPNVKWIQSFADERCGGYGIVYQACNFNYYGEHISEFYEFEGEIYHKIMFTNEGRSASNSPKAKRLRAEKENANKILLRQFRYIFFIDKGKRKKCLLKPCPYPKYYNENKAV